MTRFLCLICKYFENFDILPPLVGLIHRTGRGIGTRNEAMYNKNKRINTLFAIARSSVPCPILWIYLINGGSMLIIDVVYNIFCKINKNFAKMRYGHKRALFSLT